MSKKKYGYCASWAIWADEGKTPKSNMDDVSFFEDNQIHTKLNPNIILLALNFSKDIKFENNFQNFHSGGKDSGGAYITIEKHIEGMHKIIEDYGRN